MGLHYAKSYFAVGFQPLHFAQPGDTMLTANDTCPVQQNPQFQRTWSIAVPGMHTHDLPAQRQVGPTTFAWLRFTPGVIAAAANLKHPA